jgi:hypothetical protein
VTDQPASRAIVRLRRSRRDGCCFVDMLTRDDEVDGMRPAAIAELLAAAGSHASSPTQPSLRARLARGGTCSALRDGELRPGL